MKKIVAVIFLIFILSGIVVLSYNFENQYITNTIQYITNIINNQENSITLPRLSLCYYFIISIFLSFLFGIISVILKKYEKISRFCKYILFLFISYIFAQIIIKKGFNFITYTLEKDLIFILLSAICIYGIIVISYNSRYKKNPRI